VVKQAKPEWETKLMANRWIFFILALVFLAIAYGFASLAINYGSFWQYALAIVFLVWAVKELKRGVTNLIHK
jgi:hypothetical protein